eukprot:2569616-Pleurochrysis_carterae.AAC.5
MYLCAKNLISLRLTGHASRSIGVEATLRGQAEPPSRTLLPPRSDSDHGGSQRQVPRRSRAFPLTFA